MKGVLKNKDGKWVVEYQKEGKIPLFGGGHKTHNQITELPLHPEDITQIKKDSLIFDDIESRIACYPEVEFEIVEEVIDLGRHGSTIGKYAKLITPKQEETNTSWDEIHQNFRKSGLDWTLHDVFRWLKENYYPPVKK